jgi:hypothetical protein
MFFEVLSPIYHSPITIQLLTYRVLLGTLAYSGSAPPLFTKNPIAAGRARGAARVIWQRDG